MQLFRGAQEHQQLLPNAAIHSAPRTDDDSIRGLRQAIFDLTLWTTPLFSRYHLELRHQVLFHHYLIAFRCLRTVGSTLLFDSLELLYFSPRRHV
jgi:hypothetical protein